MWPAGNAASAQRSPEQRPAAVGAGPRAVATAPAAGVSLAAGVAGEPAGRRRPEPALVLALVPESPLIGYPQRPERGVKRRGPSLGHLRLGRRCVYGTWRVAVPRHPQRPHRERFKSAGPEWRRSPLPDIREVPWPGRLVSRPSANIRVPCTTDAARPLPAEN